MDKRVEIHGTSRAGMNGKRGVATNFHWNKEGASKWCYTVQLGGGESFKLKPSNVRAEATGAATTGAGNSKGKGKKGRAKKGA